MIKHWIITGDTHGQNETRLKNIQLNMPEYAPEETAIIILGDVGFQYYKNKKDWKNKYHAAKMGYTLYCLRGNHEDRISNSKDAHRIYDDEVKGFVWVEDEFPNIKYFDDDVEEYIINGKKVLTIPGAYSVDKWYRLQNNWMWFAEEQLTEVEMKFAEKVFGKEHYDLVLSHTAPIAWEPNDLFLRGIDQSKVDKTMEVWLNSFKDIISWDLWLFGHYHADRIERPYVEQFYQEYEDLNSIFDRWTKYHKTGELDWWLPKSPNFYMGVENNG